MRETFTVEEGLDLSEVESLRDEMQEWVDNMGGTALENTSRYQMASDAVDTLDNVDSIDFKEIWNEVKLGEDLDEDTLKGLRYECTLFKVKSRRQSPSRAYRLSNVLSVANGAIECLRSYLEPYGERADGVRSVLDDIESSLQDFDSVEFPTMYG